MRQTFPLYLVGMIIVLALVGLGMQGTPPEPAADQSEPLAPRYEHLLAPVRLDRSLSIARVPRDLHGCEIIINRRYSIAGAMLPQGKSWWPLQRFQSDGGWPFVGSGQAVRNLTLDCDDEDVFAYWDFTG